MAEVYGTAWLEAARDDIKTLLDELVSSMATGYDPTISYAYERHDMLPDLPAVSVDLLSSENNYIWRNNEAAVGFYEIPFSVRVHTAYMGGVQDGVKVGRLLNSVINKLEANRSLRQHYHIDTIELTNPLADFTESYTRGGEVTVTVKILVSHTQE